MCVHHTAGHLLVSIVISYVSLSNKIAFYSFLYQARHSDYTNIVCNNVSTPNKVIFSYFDSFDSFANQNQIILEKNCILNDTYIVFFLLKPFLQPERNI